MQQQHKCFMIETSDHVVVNDENILEKLCEILLVGLRPLDLEFQFGPLKNEQNA